MYMIASSSTSWVDDSEEDVVEPDVVEDVSSSIRVRGATTGEVTDSVSEGTTIRDAESVFDDRKYVTSNTTTATSTTPKMMYL